jgi:hypothetical protein
MIEELIGPGEMYTRKLTRKIRMMSRYQMLVIGTFFIQEMNIFFHENGLHMKIAFREGMAGKK